MHLVATLVVMLLGAVELVRSAPLDLVDLEGVDKADAMMVRFLEWFKQAAESAKLNKDCEYRKTCVKRPFKSRQNKI